MNTRPIRRIVAQAGAALLLLGATGCGALSSSDERGGRDPLIRRAQALKNVQDIDGAIHLYQRALDKKPTLARAHLDLGLLFDTYKQDYVRAIYHYQRYLELQPDSEKRQLIEDMIHHARLSFAASLPDQPSGAVQEIALLKREIEALKQQLAAQRKAQGAARRPAGPAAAPADAAAAAAPAPAQPAVDAYVVEPGDTLSRIASKKYNDANKWKTIYDANRGQLPTPEAVRVGQTLMIPRQ